jgi:pimeloyl-ACP methyl ester carboxylesterase
MKLSKYKIKRFLFSILLVFTGITNQINAQQPLKRFLQPTTVINSIPYGANPKAANYAVSGDARIYYEVYGKGDPFVLLHGGLLGSSIEMASFIDSLSKKYQVIVISTRGHGKSELGSSPITLTQRATDVLNVVKAITNEKLILLGFSDGGYTAYQFGAMFPDRVKKMIVIGAGELYPGSRSFGFTSKQAITLDSSYWAQQISLMPQPKRLEELFQGVANCYNKLTVGKELFGSIKCPVLVMAGDRDDGNPVQRVLNAALMIPNHQLSIIPNAGHPAFLDNFAAVWAAIVPFINE